MRKSVQKNHNKAGFKKIHAPHPTNKKKHRFHPLKQDKIGTIIFQFHFTDPLQTLRTHYRPSRPIGPIRPIRHKKHQ